MVNIREICPELAAKARDELHEVSSRIPNDIAILREWITKQPHIKARTDDQFLVNFLRGAKYSMEKAKQKLDYYYTIRSLSPDVFLYKSIDDSIIKFAKTGTYVPLPKPLGADGPRLHIIRYDNLDPNEFKFEDVIKYQLRILDIQMREDDNVIIGGTVSIYDMAKMSLRFLMQLDPSLLRKVVIYSEKAIPQRIRGVHVINMPKEARTVINFFRSFLSKKINERTMIHASLDDLYEHIPKEYLPTEYGGTSGSIQEAADDWVQRMIEHKQFFEEEQQYGVDEKLRPGPPVTSEILFGLDGSFRKLQID